ncbi:MAG: DUF938 domain-containing protein [Alphaproteobacteria bacterium]|nr:DUF938 domain-containing protein [Alphaproteobacteria bacterium]
MKRHYPATARNRDPILAVLRRVLPDRGRVVEISCGSGEHGLHFARALPGLSWQPTDIDPDALASTEAWRAEEGPANLLPPLRLDVTAPWPVDAADAVYNANMIHIAPWACTLGLLDGAAAVLSPGAPLVMYGPYRRGGLHTAPSNAAFDDSLQARDPSWGVRDLDEVAEEARVRGLLLEEVVEMPANNLTVVYRRT